MSTSNHQMNTRTCLVLLALLHLLATPKSFAAETPKSNEERVRDYVSAFNKREIDTMLSMVSDDIQWLNVAGDKITVETQARTRCAKVWRPTSSPLRAPSRSWSGRARVRVTASRVAELERAAWQGKSGPKSQASLSLYEFRGGLISRAYYYPAVKIRRGLTVVGCPARARSKRPCARKTHSQNKSCCLSIAPHYTSTIFQNSPCARSSTHIDFSRNLGIQRIHQSILLESVTSSLRNPSKP